MTDKLTPLPTPDADDLVHLAKYDAAVRVRALVEREILRRTIAALLAAGYHLQINDGEEDQTPLTTDAALLLKESCATDEDILYVFKPGEADKFNGEGFVHFIYGNTGWDVISDYSVNLATPLEPVFEYADEMSEWF